MFTKGMFFFLTFASTQNDAKKNSSFKTLDNTVKNVKRSHWRRDFIL